MKMKFQFFHRAKIGQNAHSNPYIESTTVLSDITHLATNNSGLQNI